MGNCVVLGEGDSLVSQLPERLCGARRLRNYESNEMMGRSIAHIKVGVFEPDLNEPVERLDAAISLQPLERTQAGVHTCPGTIVVSFSVLLENPI